MSIHQQRSVTKSVVDLDPTLKLGQTDKLLFISVHNMTAARLFKAFKDFVRKYVCEIKDKFIHF